MESKKLVSMVRRQDRNGFFENRVDEVRDNAPGYYSVIQHPISLGEICEKVQRGGVKDLDILEDIHRMLNNAMIYNPPRHPVHEEAKRIEGWVIHKVSKTNTECGGALNLLRLARGF